MRIPFVHLDLPLDGVATGAVLPLSDEQQHHLTTVLRRADGDDLEVADGVGRTAPAVLRSHPDGVVGAEVVGDVVVHPRRTPDVHVLHALPKGRGLDEVVRTLTELGVSRVEPLVTHRTEARPHGAGAERAARRWRQIASSAEAQARNPHRCEVLPPRRLVVDDEHVAPDEIAVVAVPGARVSLGHVVGRAAPPSRVRLLVGPEGGLTDEEVAGLVGRGWTAARAGDTVLRSVHAATVLVAATMALTGRYSSD